MKFIVNDKRANIYSFVIMPNHIHLIWQVADKYKTSQVQHSFLKFTAQQFKFKLKESDSDLLEEFRVSASDRHYQFWERNPLSIDLFSRDVFLQKFNYIHNNPLQEKWKLTSRSQDYKYCSARFYETGINDFGFLSHYADIEIV